MLVVAAPAKLNLSLEVVARRPDGYHDLDSIVAPLDWHDLVGLHAEPAAHTTVVMRLTGPAAAGVPSGPENLAARAAQALVEASGAAVSLTIWLDKRLPHAAGLGGGSADAGAVLRGGAELLGRLGCAVPRAALTDIAAALGSDVPAALRPAWWRLRGRGEELTALPGGQMDLAVALAGASSTPGVYAALRPEECAGDGRSARLEGRLRSGQPPVDEDLGSALEGAALRESEPLRTTVSRLRAATPGQRWQMTGSGGAFFAVTEDRAGAEQLATLAGGIGLAARACRTLDGGLP
ncbi:MAG: 4-(cytidine 5'-diphospho)-2-C-methyl-D-erythritol kinase [Candidatus Dormibacteria bacterium]